VLGRLQGFGGREIDLVGRSSDGTRGRAGVSRRRRTRCPRLAAAATAPSPASSERGIPLGNEIRALRARPGASSVRFGDSPRSIGTVSMTERNIGLGTRGPHSRSVSLKWRLPRLASRRLRRFWGRTTLAEAVLDQPA
jgi:hypothetical protein